MAGLYDQLEQLNRAPSPAPAPSVGPPDGPRTASGDEKDVLPRAGGKTAATAAYGAPLPGDSDTMEPEGPSPRVPTASEAQPGRNPARKDGSPESREDGKSEGPPAGRTKPAPPARPAGGAGKGAEVLLAGQMEAVRRAVREVGRERADVSLTAEEKEALREIAYLRTQRGKRTTINDLIRVAVNWLLEDHASRKERSLLARSLDRIQS